MPEPDDVTRLLPVREGHFLFESGHHSGSWIDLERLFLEPGTVRPFAHDLAERLRAQAVDAVCGPLVEGAFVALLVAERLAVPFTYAERFEEGEPGTLFPVRYRLPGALREVVRGRRVGIVNDVVSAGSAVKGAHDDLLRCGATPVAIATLAVVGGDAERFALEAGLALVTLVSLESAIWTPGECPLCARGVPLSD
jgi:orotate phosphoribosyltransferase